jgi:hypothetical protein
MILVLNNKLGRSFRGRLIWLYHNLAIRHRSLSVREVALPYPPFGAFLVEGGYCITSTGMQGGPERAMDCNVVWSFISVRLLLWLPVTALTPVAAAIPRRNVQCSYMS